MRKFIIALASISSALFASSTLAQAIIPDASYSFQLENSGIEIRPPGDVPITSFAPVTYSLGGLAPTFGGILTSVTIDPNNASVLMGDTQTLVQTPRLTSTTTVDLQPSGNADSQANINYFFSVLGPPNVLVPLMIYVNGGFDTNRIQNGAPLEASFNLTGASDIFLDARGIGQVDLGKANLTISKPANEAQASVTETTSFPSSFIDTYVMSDLTDAILMSVSSYVALSVPGIGTGQSRAQSTRISP